MAPGLAAAVNTSDETRSVVKATSKEVKAARVSFDKAREVEWKASSSNRSPKFGLKARPLKISKSRGNVVNPDVVVHNMAPTRCGSTKCSWARSKPPSLGAWKG